MPLAHFNALSMQQPGGVFLKHKFELAISSLLHMLALPKFFQWHPTALRNKTPVLKMAQRPAKSSPALASSELSTQQVLTEQRSHLTALSGPLMPPQFVMQSK